MAWYWTGDKPLLESVVMQVSNILYIHVCVCIARSDCIYPSVAGTRIFWVDIIAIDALAPFVGRTSTVIVLLMTDKLAPVFHEERFQHPVPSNFWEMLKQLKYIFMFCKVNLYEKGKPVLLNTIDLFRYPWSIFPHCIFLLCQGCHWSQECVQPLLMGMLTDWYTSMWITVRITSTYILTLNMRGPSYSV